MIGRLAVVALIPATTASAQSVTLTESSGRPLTIGAAAFAQGLETTTLTPPAIVEEFARLCFPDPASASLRVTTSPLELAPDPVVFPPVGRKAAVRVAQWRSPTAALALIPGDDAGLKGRQIVIDERGYQVAGSYGPFRVDGNQCNLVLRLAGLPEAAALGSALAAKFGPDGKLVVKKSFADGHWSMNGVSVNFTAPATRYGSQPVHLSVQMIAKKAK